jgi:hypothetical protein
MVSDSSAQKGWHVSKDDWCQYRVHPSTICRELRRNTAQRFRTAVDYLGKMFSTELFSAIRINPMQLSLLI